MSERGVPNGSGGSGNNGNDCKDNDANRKKEKRFDRWPPSVQRQGHRRRCCYRCRRCRRCHKGPKGLNKTPTIVPTLKCKLRLLKSDQVKDFLLLEQEFIRNHKVIEPNQEEQDQEECEKLEELHKSPLGVGNLEEMIDENHVIVSSSVGPEYYVSILSSINQDLLDSGCSVMLHNKTMSIVGILQDETDPMASVMKVEKAPLETYADVGGREEQIQEIKEAMELPLACPELYKDIGIKPPKGVILYGEPGTGKTLLAKAVANQTSATFLHVVESELIQKYLDDGPKLVQDLFRVADDLSPTIVFIDEIDAVGSKHYESSSGGTREIQHTMLELLNQLDGFDEGGDVKVTMATTCIESPDPALICPGLIDHKIEFLLPDTKSKHHVFNIRTSTLPTSSGGIMHFIEEGDGWYALMPQGKLPVHASSGTVVGPYLDWLGRQERSVVQSRIHVIPGTSSPTGVASVYLGRLGLFGGTKQSYTSAPMWSSPSCKKQLHSVVVVPPGKEVCIPYPFPLGWRSLSHYLHVVQEVPDASYHVRPLQANFSYSSSNQEGRNQHNATSQFATGPSAGIPMFGVEADLKMGHHSSQAQGAQHYATSSTHTTHDGLELHASVPCTYRKKGRLFGRYKDAPITQSLKLQLEVILEHDGTAPSSPPQSAPSHVRPQSVGQPGHTSTSTAPPLPFIQERLSPSLSARPAESSFEAVPTPSSPAPAPAPAPAAYSFEEIEALLARKLQDPDVVLNDAESIALLTHCVELGEENVGKVSGKEAIVILGNTGSGKSTFVNYLLGCEMLKKFPRELGMKGTAKVVVVRSKSEGGPLDEVMPIGHTKISKTFVPHIQADFDDPQLVYCDCPGFLDNRGAEVNIANAVNIRRVLQSSCGVKVLVLVNYHSLRANRGSGLREMLQICTQLFGSSSQLTAHKDSLLLGLTQVPSDEADLEGFRDWLLEGSPAVMTSLCERLFLYDPIDDTSGDYLSRLSCLEALRGLQAIPQRDSGKLFHTVLTDSDERMLVSVVEKQGKQLRDHLRSEQYGQAATVWRNLNCLRVIDHISVERMLNDDSLKIQRMLSRRVAKFRDDSVHYHFSAARSQLASLKDIARHFSAEDLYLLELDIAGLSQHLAYFERKKAQEDHREAILHQLSDRLDAISQQRSLLEERLRSQSEESSKEQSRLHAEMVRRDADHELQVTRLREEQAEFLRKQAEAAELQQATSEEERTRQREEREQMRKDYESRLRAAEEERKAVRIEYEKMLQAQEASKQAAEVSLRKELSQLMIVEQQTQAAQQQAKLPIVYGGYSAFGPREWKKYFGEVGESPPLPDGIKQILESSCPFWKGKRVQDTHLLTLIPASVNGNPFSLNLLFEELIQHPCGGGHATEYRHYNKDVRAQYGSNSPRTSYWVLLTCDVLYGSRSKSYKDQQAMVGDYASRGYDLPTGLEAATSILMHHVRSGECLYSDAPWTYTRCSASELVHNEFPIAIGGFESAGLSVEYLSFFDYRSHGVACCRKFN